MKKLTTAMLALVLAGSLTACAKSAETPVTPSSSAPTAAASTTPGDMMSSDSTADDSTSGTSTGSATTSTAAPVAVDQSTPEKAMTSWLGAMVAGEGQTVCNLMATDGKAISSIPGAAQACGSTITPMLDQIKQLGAAFEGLTITGATVKGNAATFESVTTTPAMAADVVSSFKAVKIDGKWYISQG